jgi:hypothetical protein
MKVLKRAGLNLVEISGQRFIMDDGHLAKLKANVQKKISGQKRQKTKGVTALDKNNEVAPEMPAMKWKGGKPDYSDLDHTPIPTRVNRDIPKEQFRVPAPPRMRWNERGEPDYGHLE